MIRITNIRLLFEHSREELEQLILETLGLHQDKLINYRIHRKSVDARKRNAVFFTYTVDVEVEDEEAVLDRLQYVKNVSRTPDMTYKYVLAPGSKLDLTSRPVIVGTGPCGLFAGLILAQMGLQPVLLERGKSVKDRIKDVMKFWKTAELDPSSNVPFGEGGAGTFSDGKLTTQIKDRDNRCRKVLEELVAAGAPDEILYLNKPHIGTDILVRVVHNIREQIISLGGGVRFESHVTDIIIEDESVRGVTLANGQEILSDNVVLAIGHSARDTFEMLSNRSVPMEPKPFSIGVRIEHPQELIDAVQYCKFAGDTRLGSADYKLVHHCSNGRSVYTFCMCPGGQVIASSSELGMVVTNGMSRYKREGTNANSALLVGVNPEDFPDKHPLAGVEFQREWEKKAFDLGGGGYKAPAQLVGDFLKKQASKEIGSVEPSYTPGVTMCDLTPCLPDYSIEALCEGIQALDRKLKGFAMPDAVMTGVETRSSSPIRILRDKDLQSVTVKGLYPAGEGAGYAGGIISSAVDGIRVAEAIVRDKAGN